MDWEQTIAALNAGFSDERIREAFREFVEATPGGQMNYDGELVNFSVESPILIEQKALVLDRQHQDGGFLMAKIVLEPIMEDSHYIGLSHGGTIKFRISFSGAYLDEVYSRDNVIPR